MALSATKLNKVKALSDIWTFADLIDFKGGKKSFAPIHYELGAFVTAPDLLAGTIKSDTTNINIDEQVTRVLILMPRGHLKSTVASVLYVLWRIYRNPNIRIVVGTNVKDLAWSFIRELRSYLEDEDLQTRVWNARPHVKGVLIPELDRTGRKKTGEVGEALDKKVIWSATAIQVVRSKKMKEPTVQATSVGSRLTGGHFDLLILDDVVDFKNTVSPETIRKTFEWAQDLESVLDPRRVEKVSDIAAVPFYDIVGDQIVVLGTRYDRQDYYQYILENAEELGYATMVRNIYRNGKDGSDGYIWHERFNDAVVAKLRKRLTARRFASQYLNTVIVSELQILNPDNVQYYNSQLAYAKPGEVEIRLNEAGKPNPRIRPYLVIDPAISENKRADNTSITVGGFDQNGELWILEQRTGHFRPLDTAVIVLGLINKWKLQTLSIEQVGAFRAVAYTIGEYLKNNNSVASIRDWKPGNNKKKTRIENYLEPFFTAMTIHLPRELQTDEIVQNEITYFPNDTVTDDVLDTWAMLVEIARPPLTDKQKQAKKIRPARAFRNTRYGGTR